MTRELPHKVVRRSSDQLHIEADEVEAKYSQKSAQIGEDSVDYVALSYLTPEASLFWLPRFFRYVKDEAPRDTYHLEVLLLTLSDRDFSGRVAPLASEVERKSVDAFLTWLAQQKDFIVLPERKSDLLEARKLWSL